MTLDHDKSIEAQREMFTLQESSMVKRKAALLVSAADQDHDLLAGIFSQQGWSLYRVAGIDAAVAFLRGNFVPVLITERDLPLGNWKDLLTAILQAPRAPLLIVASRLADERLWAEVLNVGGYNVLCKPFQTQEVLWVLNSAWLEIARPHELTTVSEGIVAAAGACSLSAAGG